MKTAMLALYALVALLWAAGLVRTMVRGRRTCAKMTLSPFGGTCHRRWGHEWYRHNGRGRWVPVGRN